MSQKTKVALNFGCLPMLLLVACGSAHPATSERDYTLAGTRGVFTRGEFDEDAARDDAIGELSSQSFEDVGDTTLCTDDCSGHQAGFGWARDQGLTSSGECGGGESQSFDEGCSAYGDAIEGRVEKARERFEGHQ